MPNPFFKNCGPFKVNDILKILKLNNKSFDTSMMISDIKDLSNAKQNEITFFHSKKYKEIAKNTKASLCITTENLKNELPKNCKSLTVKNVLVSTALITAKFYPDSINDDFDKTAININLNTFKNDVKFGKNVLVGENVKIGKNCSIGHNTICLLYTSPSPRDGLLSRMPSSA